MDGVVRLEKQDLVEWLAIHSCVWHKLSLLVIGVSHFCCLEKRVLPLLCGSLPEDFVSITGGFELFFFGVAIGNSC